MTTHETRILDKEAELAEIRARLGAHNKIQQAKNAEDLFKGYRLIDTLLESYSGFEVLSFDHDAITEFFSLKSLNLRINKLDLRIASIALSRSMTVVTATSPTSAGCPI